MKPVSATNEQHRRERILLLCEQVCLFVIFASTIFPPLRTVGNNYVITTAAFVIWLLLICVTKRPAVSKITLSRGLAFAALICILLCSLLAGNMVMLNRYIRLILLFIGYQIYKVYKDSDDLDTLRPVMVFSLLLGAVTFVLTFYGLLDDPWLSRSLKSSGEYSIGYSRRGIGGYEYVYFVVLFGLLVFYRGVCQAGWRRLLCLVAAFVILLFILWSSYMTALVVYVAGLCVAFFFHHSKSGGHSFVSRCAAMLLLVCLCVALLLLADVVLFPLLNDVLGNTRITKVFAEGDLLGSLSEEFVVDRLPTLEKSIDVFLENPLAGTVVAYSSSGSSYVVSLAGQHSFILDTFAYFGVVVGALTLACLISQFVEMKRSDVAKAPLHAIGLAFFVLLLIDNATPSIAFAALVCLPAICSCEGLNFHAGEGRRALRR